MSEPRHIGAVLNEALHNLSKQRSEELSEINKAFFLGSARSGMSLVERALQSRDEQIEALRQELALVRLEAAELRHDLEATGSEVIDGIPY